MSITILKNSFQTSKLQTIYLANIVWQRNNYSSQPQIIKDPTTASLRRGTGGRSSFNGIICTIFGATGFVGRYLCNSLGKIGTQLIIPHRGHFYRIKHLRLNGDLGQVIFLPFDLRDEETIYKALKYSNVVVNLVSSDWPTSNYSYDDVHVEGARRIAKIAKETCIERFIHVSDLNASPNPKPKVIKTGSEYLKAKWAGECAVREEFPEATIVRPSAIYGIEDRFLHFHCSKFNNYRDAPVLWKRGEQTIKQPVSVLDVAAGITAIVNDDSTVGKTYQFVGPKRYTLHNIVDWIQPLLTDNWRKFNLKIRDLEKSPLFQCKIILNEWYGYKHRVNYLHWEQIERDSTTDVVLPDLPKLEDLGINPIIFEDQAPWDLKIYARHGYYHKKRLEFFPPAPLESLPC